ncbi:hypothetical protein, partial [Salmonella enterica]|uniref:hypothetical protein n=1 Tax=Salmonella enterica TaxID=28901 RepID=UPI003CE6B206
MEFEGVVRNVERRYRETTSDYVREQMEKYMTEQPCPTCHGNRLKKESLAVFVGDKHIGEVTAMSVNEALTFFETLQLTEKEQ